MMGFKDPRVFLEHAKDHEIALVVIDVWMPGLSGLEVQRLLQTIAPATPVIIMTARDDPGMNRIALAQSGVAFFAKPFGDTVFLEAVLRALPKVGFIVGTSITNRKRLGAIATPSARS
jgi:FixJ family two-component response regulator